MTEWQERTDQSGVGEVFMEEIGKSGLKDAQGIMLCLPKKQEVMVHLKQLMQEGRLHIPYEPELINEMNAERYELTKTGQIQFSHSAGTHDDRLWAPRLAVYASRPEIPEYHPVVLRGRTMKPWRPKPVKWPIAGKDNTPVLNRVICLGCWNPKSPRMQVSRTRIENAGASRQIKEMGLISFTFALSSPRLKYGLTDSCSKGLAYFTPGDRSEREIWRASRLFYGVNVLVTCLAR